MGYVTDGSKEVYTEQDIKTGGLTDRHLVEACLEGNRDAFAELVCRYQDAVYGLAVGMTRNREDAADMAQEAFIRAYAKLELYNPDYSFKPWILRICANQTKNLFRKRMRRRKAETVHLKEETIAGSAGNPDFDELETALGQLPPSLCAPLRLKHMEGLSYGEISRILGIGISAAKMRVMRARKQLIEILNNDT